MKDKVINGNRIVEIKGRLKQLDEEETRLQFIDFQSNSTKARLREIWKEQGELRIELKELEVN